MEVQNTTAKKAPRGTAKPLTDEQKAAAAAKRAATIAAKGKAKEDSAFTIITYAALAVASALAKGSTYYSRAIIYHRSQGTAFPRSRNAGELARLQALTADQAKAEVANIMRMHDAKTLSAGNKTGQTIFDCYMTSIAAK